MNLLHRLIAGAIKLYARIAASLRAWSAEGQRIEEIEDRLDEDAVRARMLGGCSPNSYCATCQSWNGHANGCAWLAANQEIIRKQRTPFDAPRRED